MLLGRLPRPARRRPEGLRLRGRAGTLNDALLERLPKAELHVHLDGSLRPATLLELARERGLPMPATDPAALADYMVVDDAASLVEYLERFEVTLRVMLEA